MTEARLMDVPLTAIRFAPANPRTDGGAGIAGLAASLEAGLAQRPTLVEVEPGVFAVLTGERRVRAGLARGWDTIPAVVEATLTPVAAHTRRVLENLHRADLGPLDEARALKLDWLNANALALDLGAQADAALAEAGSVRAGLEIVAALLAQAGWSPSRPAVTQAAYLTERGLGISKAALRKKLQLLNLSLAAEAHLDDAGLTEAGMRAFVRLDQDDQATLLDALAADPALAKETRTIVGWVRDPTRQRTMTEALALARGDTSAASVPTAPLLTHALPDAPESTSAALAVDAVPPGAPVPLDAASAAGLVLPLLESVPLVVEQLTALHGLDLTQLPAPWDTFARDALATLATALQPFTAQMSTEGGTR